MSPLSSMLLSHLEKELTKIEPEAAQFFVEQLKAFSADIVLWAEKKIQVGSKKDGKVKNASD